jgi:hypothetical protein
MAENLPIREAVPNTQMMNSPTRTNSARRKDRIEAPPQLRTWLLLFWGAKDGSGKVRIGEV